ncbi:hypothetical protein L596_025270 [Steinernema carpocapsae]|uniref:Transposase Tc5 C-terminal domain-containing protein n=1 Tax=Steinernema carpocapsae TaxID=34508 RepID=A0A4U5M7A9_STECR|nr:hypothetical protein L596_025270 [Steinernema carpocapsae]
MNIPRSLLRSGQHRVDAERRSETILRSTIRFDAENASFTAGLLQTRPELFEVPKSLCFHFVKLDTMCYFEDLALVPCAHCNGHFCLTLFVINQHSCQ